VPDPAWFKVQAAGAEACNMIDDHRPQQPTAAPPHPQRAPFVDLRTTPVDPRAAETVPPADASRLGVLPFAIRDGALVVAVADSNDNGPLDQVRAMTGRPVIAVSAAPADLTEAIDRYAKAVGGAPPVPAPEPPPMAPPATPGLPPTAPTVVAPAPPTGPVAPAASISQPATVVAHGLGRGESPELPFGMNELLEKMIELGASDLHLTVGVPPMARVHGELSPIEGYQHLDADDVRGLIYSILPQRQRERFEAELELDCSHALPGNARFRINVYYQRDAVGAAFRIIPVEPRSLEELGLPQQVGSLSRLPRGLVLVTGPTGSGKSSTLAALIDMANTERTDHIVTVEDPIEFLHRHKRCIVNQREVGEDTKSFATALKHVLRQDPDIILIGELRDLETVSAALTAAETGHLVFATLHTQDAPQTIDRVIDVFPTSQQQQIRVQLAGALQGILCQQLVPTADGAGRAVAVEVLVATPAVRNLIREAKTHQVYSAMQAGGKFGMQTMDAHLADLVRRGRIDYQHGLQRCHHVEDYNRLCGRG
jgi:twitching motility protein PilT